MILVPRSRLVVVAAAMAVLAAGCGARLDRSQLLAGSGRGGAGIGAGRAGGGGEAASAADTGAAGGATTANTAAGTGTAATGSGSGPNRTRCERD